MQVEGSVDGKPCRLTVDTGAEKTLVRPDMVAARRLPVAPQRLCGVTGHCVQLRGPVEVRIGVGSAVERLPVYVAELDEPCLLGLDYLTRSKACVDLGRRLVRVRGEEVPLLPVVGGAEVVVADSARIAPRSEARVRCRLSRAMRGAEAMVEPKEDLRLAEGADRLWRYHGPGHYSWGQGQGDVEASAGSSGEDVADEALDEEERVVEDGGEPGAGDAIGPPLPASPLPVRPRRQKRKPAWLKDFHTMAED